MRSMSKSILIVALTALAMSMPVLGKPQVSKEFYDNYTGYVNVSFENAINVSSER